MRRFSGDSEGRCFLGDGATLLRIDFWRDFLDFLLLGFVFAMVEGLALGRRARGGRIWSQTAIGINKYSYVFGCVSGLVKVDKPAKDRAATTTGIMRKTNNIQAYRCRGNCRERWDEKNR